MSGVLEEVLLGVVANGFTTVLARVFRSDRGISRSVEVAIADATASYIEEREIALDPGSEGQLLEEFLPSPEARLVVEQLFVGGLDSDLRTTEEIRQEFIALWEWKTGVRTESRATIGHIFDVLAFAADSAMEAAIGEGVLSAAEARSASRHREVMSSLANIAWVNSLISARESVTPETLSDYSHIYLRQVRQREGSITPPNFDSARKVPLEDLYVRPQMTEYAGLEPVVQVVNAVDDLPHRAVVLGNPGGGKSTLAKKVVVDATNWSRASTSPGASLMPFLVVIRDFANFKASNPRSIAAYLEAVSSSHYQVAPPPGAIEHVLTMGKALVVFDGLDELLDTSRRQEVSADIESFASRFPATRILVTSRQVGYEQAPLDAAVWRTFQLEEFEELRVFDYVEKWFALDPTLTIAEREMHVEYFAQESELVSDLRSNPLMLGLMCNLYRGAGYIPRNRPDVYEQCSVMLFERWDSQRRIIPELGFERHLRPAMRFLAYWIYTQIGLQGGVNEDRLVEKAAGYLEGRRFDDPDEALSEARNFVRFCRGRAWVFTDVGADPAGQRLYQFTHRTFLEYFTAEYLATTHVTPQGLVEFLRPKIGREEWDEVSQLAFQIKDKHLSGAADELLGGLIASKGKPFDDAARRRLRFAARALAFLAPRPKTSRTIAERVVDLALAGKPTEPPTSATERWPGDEIAELARAAPDNIQAITVGVTARLREKIDSTTAPILAAQLALNIRHSTGDMPFWSAIPAAIVESHGARLVGLSQISPGVAVDATVAGCLSVEDLLAQHGVEALFAVPRLWAWPSRRRTGINQWIVASCLGTRPRGSLGGPERARQSLPAITRALLGRQPPWFRVDTPYLNLEWPFLPEPSITPGSFSFNDWSADEKFALLMLMASIAEEARLSDQLGPAGTGPFFPDTLERLQNASASIGPGQELIQGWATGVDQTATITELDLAPEQATLLRAWVGRRINLATLETN